ncbi:MAG: serine/threonine protein kinase [Clostridia bacterium]|nr:serine/threonine protein kinase [Clostridia bacterium]MBP5649311.1 serine/threonine protein kinase [Clostridia bacterium]
MGEDKKPNICLFCGGVIDSSGACSACKKRPRVKNNPPQCLKYGSLLRGRYIIAEPVGEGGTGITYSAFDIQSGQHLAIKEYFPQHLAERSKTSPNLQVKSIKDKEPFAKGLARFIAEARRMMDLQSLGGFPSIEALFSENATSYIVMEFVSGVSLRHYVKTHLIINKKTMASILSPVFQTISRLHENGIVHCDISPDNIMVSKDKKGRLIDFGASKKADFSGVDISALVKDGYSPPELYRINSHPTKEADVYSLAATIYFICEKKNLPLSTNPKKVALALDQINDDRFGEDFLVILDRALSDKPSARQHSVKEFAEDLKRVLKL